MHITYDLPVAVEDILETKERLAGEIYRTGMSRSNYFSERCKGEVSLKFENMQRAGSFEVRDALNKLSSLIGAERCEGVVAYSAGNRAQGVSSSYAMLGIDGKAVMSKGASKSKVAVTYDYSAEVVLHGDNFNDTIAKTSGIVETEGRIFVPPYDDPRTIAGQDTIDLEILEDLYDVDSATVPISDSGLIAGIAVAIKSINPIIKAIGIQSENVHDTVASSHAGEMTTHRTTSALTDSCGISRPGTLIHEIVRELVDDIVLVSEDKICSNVMALIRRNKVVTKSVGALACVTLLSGKLNSYIRNRKTVSIIFSGDIDLSRISQITGLVNV